MSIFGTSCFFVCFRYAARAARAEVIGLDLGRLCARHSYFALSRLTTGQAAVLADFAGRLQIVVNRLGAFDLAWARGLPVVWLKMAQGWRAPTFAKAAEEAGVLMRSADQYAMVHGRAPNAERLAVAGKCSRADLEHGVGILARLLASPPSDMAV